MTNKLSVNRLQLDFKLELRSERTAFIDEYLKKILFKPTEEELDLMAKYILWGKEKTEDKGKAARLRHEGFELETRYTTWAATPTESLDALFESPSFSEASISNIPLKFIKPEFSREDARLNAPPYLQPTFENLWRQIDELDLLLTYYDLSHSKRTAPPSPSLLSRIPRETQLYLESQSHHLGAYTYAKRRHELVELRRQQFTLRDSYCEPLLDNSSVVYSEPIFETFGVEIPVYPIGLTRQGYLYSKLFNPERMPAPADFNEEELSQISLILWSQPSLTSLKPNANYFDFSNPTHLHALFSMEEELREAALESTSESNLPLLLQTLNCYHRLANLDPILETILQLKIQGESTQKIADQVNLKFHKNYKANYISTLYCKKALAQIAATATNHREVVENLFFPENFKTCKDCGRTLLLNPDNFVRRGRSKDGFSPRCKLCEKIKRNGG